MANTHGYKLWISLVGVFFSMMDLGLSFTYMNSIEAYVRCWMSTLDTKDDYYTACANATARQTNNEFTKYTTMWSFCVSSIAIGGFFAPIPIGIVSDKLGRKKGLLTLTAVSVLGHCLAGASWLANSYALLVTGRLLAGFHGAAIIAVGPPYLNEIAPTHLLGIFGSTIAVSVVCGMMVGSVLALPQLFGNLNLWPWLTVAGLVFSAVQLISLLVALESPNWLAAQDHKTEGSKKYELAHKDDMSGSSESLAQESLWNTWRLCFTTPHIRSAVLKITIFYIFQNLTGTPAMLQYSGAVFQAAKIPMHLIPYLNMGFFAVNIVGSLGTACFVDRWGRKKTYAVSASVCAICCLLVFTMDFFKETRAVSYAIVASIIIFQASANFGIISVAFIMAGEWVPDQFRQICNLFATLIGFVAQFAVSFAFPALLENLQRYAFIVLAVINGMALVYCLTVKLRLTVKQDADLKSKRVNSFVSLLD